MDSRRDRRRLLSLMAAGLVDSLCLSVAWTVVVLQVQAAHGLAATGLCSAAMLTGIALSAPAAGWLARRLGGRHLLRVTALVEAALRLSVFLLLFSAAPVWALASCLCAMNVVAWTGYAAMRAEVAAISPGPAALTWYGTTVAAVEAVGVGVAAVVPGLDHVGANAVLLVVLGVYVLALVPTAVVAGGSTVVRATRRPAGGRKRRAGFLTVPVVSGTVLMFAGSAPTLLAVALAVELHGRSAIGPAAAAFTVGSLAAPTVAGWIQGRDANRPLAWVLCATGMVALWALAPLHVTALCLAQVCSGLFMTTLEGLLDTTVATSRSGEVTGALAGATAGRALGSAAGTAVLPVVVVAVGLQNSVAVVTGALLLVAVTLSVLRPRVPVWSKPVRTATSRPEEARVGAMG